jgi:hypothetical protein
MHMSATNDFAAIRIGSRVRHSDGTAGRITWANGVSVKIEWDDGEKVTWKRADLADKGLALLDEAEGRPAEQEVEAPAAPEPAPEQVIRGDGRPVTVTVPPKDDPAFGPERQVDGPAEAPAEPVAPEPTATPEPAKKRRARTTKAAEVAEKKLSALDAAAKVLGEQGKPMSCQALIGAMAGNGYWTSPGGKTPAATLYSAMLREIDTKGDAARFVKVGRGQFGLRP